MSGTRGALAAVAAAAVADSAADGPLTQDEADQVAAVLLAARAPQPAR